MDEIHEINKAEKLANDIAEILERLMSVEQKLDALCRKFGLKHHNGEN